MSRTVADLLDIAAGELKTMEGPNNDNKYGRELGSNNLPWCGIADNPFNHDGQYLKGMQDNVFDLQSRVWGWRDADGKAGRIPTPRSPATGRHDAADPVLVPRPGTFGGHFALDGTDHETHRAQATMIRHYIAWRNPNPRPRTT